MMLLSQQNLKLLMGMKPVNLQPTRADYQLSLNLHSISLDSDLIKTQSGIKDQTTDCSMNVCAGFPGAQFTRGEVAASPFEIIICLFSFFLLHVWQTFRLQP